MIWIVLFFFPSNVHSSRKEVLLYIFEDNEAVIKMITKGRSPSMKHVSRTHRVALDWLFDRISLDPKIQIKYIDTKNQLADMLTKGYFTLVISVLQFVLKRCQKEHKKMQVKKESQQNQSRWWVLRGIICMKLSGGRRSNLGIETIRAAGLSVAVASARVSVRPASACGRDSCRINPWHIPFNSWNLAWQ